MLGGKSPADGGRLHGSKQEAREREWQEGIEIRPVDVRKARCRETLGYLTQKLDAPNIEPEKRRGHDPTDDHKERHRFVLQEELPQDERRQSRKPNAKGDGIGLVQMAEEVTCVLPEITMRPVNTEELRQLSAGKKKRHAAFEAHHDALGDEIHNRTSAYRPGDQRDNGDEHGSACRERTEAARVP